MNGSTGRRSGVLSAPFSGWAWRATIHHVVGFPVAVVGFVLTLVPLALSAGLAVTWVFGLAALTLLLGTTAAFTAVQRSRFRSVLGVDIPAVRRDYPGGMVRRLLARATAGATWRQIVYHLLALVTGTVGFVVVTLAWSVGLAATLVLAYSAALPHHGLFGVDMRAPLPLAMITAAGVALLLLAPWLARGLAQLDAAAARGLLGPSRADQLAQRVDSLTLSREGVVDAADAERRRIERDLHDGTQQRLVSLAMNLGLAREKLAEAPEPARQAIAQAHEEAKRALAELRDFIRGLHPAVLDDRGLDAAISGIAAHAPLPVTVRVEVARRCSPTIEAIAYFVVSEALTNVARHAGATRARVEVERIDDRLHVQIRDDGRGGAALSPAGPGGGSGLRGLAQRVASVDGTLTIDSPAGGPTVITAELPCER